MGPAPGQTLGAPVLACDDVQLAELAELAVSRLKFYWLILLVYHAARSEFGDAHAAEGYVAEGWALSVGRE